MEIHLLGTAGYHPNEHRHTACMMIPEAGVILDAGTGFFRVRDLIQTPDLHIFLSHCHLDHCFGLSFYIDTVFEKDVKNIFVYGAGEKLNAIRTHLFSEHLFPLQPDFHWVEIEENGSTEQSFDVPLGGKLTTIPLRHPGGSIGFRIDWPETSLAYITDTTADDKAAYVPFIAGAKLLLHECHFPDGLEKLAETTGHSCLTPVAKVCAASKVNQCVIVHLNPLTHDAKPLNLQSVQDCYANLSIGQDRMVVSF